MPREEFSWFKGSERFQLQRCLGTGAFGEVYEAYDAERDCFVAIKKLHDAGGEALLGFKREFRALAHVTHPNLVGLYELISQEGQWFFTMELVRGVNVLEYVKGSGSDAESRIHRLRWALMQLGQGLLALHEAGMLHRDIKPSNILVTPEGTVKLLDFGMVTTLRQGELGTGDSTAGTPAFMSPEQAAGEGVSEASDWYAVGAVLYEALTGRLPFPGESAEVLVNKQWFEPQSPAELASDVPPDLNTLCRSLLAREPSERPTGRELLRRLREGTGIVPPLAPVWLRRAREVPLVGRKSELRRLEEALQQAVSGPCATIFVTGFSGVGKTALVRRFLELRSSETVILTGRCYQQESVPFKAVDTLIDSLCGFLNHLSREECDSLVPEDAHCLAKLFPVLRKLPSLMPAHERDSEVTDHPESRRRGFAALRTLFSRLSAKRRCILFIDDVQWGDLDSAALLEELIRPPAPPILLLIAFRTEEEEMSPLLKRLRPALMRLGRHTDILVPPLEKGEAEEMTRLLLAQSGSLPASLAGSIARESGGNPFLIDELVSYREFAGDGIAGAPPPLEAMILARVSRLPVAARTLLEIVSVAGIPVEESVVRQASSARADELRTLALLRTAHLIRHVRRGDRNEIEVAHDRIRETVLAQLSVHDLKARHFALAEALEQENHADPETLGTHFREAGDRRKATRYAALAAGKASQAMAFDQAARLYERALEHSVEGSRECHRLRIQLGIELANAGRGEESSRMFLRAATDAPLPEALELKRRAAEQLLRSGHIDSGLETLRDVLSPLGLEFPSTPRSALVSLWVQRVRIRLRRLAFQERKEESIPPQTLLKVDTCWSVSAGLGIVDTVRGADFQARHLLLALNSGEPYRVLRALALEAAYSATRGGKTAARTEKLLASVDLLAKRVKQPDAEGIAALSRGISAALEGRWKTARPLTEKAEKIFRERCSGVAWELFNSQYFSLLGLYYLGELKELAARFPVLLKEAEERGDLYAATSLATRIGFSTRLAADAPAEARRELATALERWSRSGFHMQHLWALFGRVEISLYEGDGAGAWREMSEGWKALDRSLLMRIQLIRIGVLQRCARSAIAAALQQPAGSSERRALLAGAERSIARMKSESAPWAKPLVLLVSAGVASARERSEEALSLLRSGESASDAADLGLYRAAARSKLGALLGGDDGKEMTRFAEDWMAGQEVRNPRRIAEMLVPGFS